VESKEMPSNCKNEYFMADGVADGNTFPTRSRLSIQQRRPDTGHVIWRISWRRRDAGRNVQFSSLFQSTGDGVDFRSTPERHFLPALCAFS
jgi:hypothetical protein